MRANEAKKARFVAAILGGMSGGEAARSVGIGTTTATRWLSDSAVVAEIEAATAAIREAARRRLAFAVDAAIDALIAVLQDTNAAAAAKVRAADILLTRGLTALESTTDGGGVVQYIVEPGEVVHEG